MLKTGGMLAWTLAGGAGVLGDQAVTAVRQNPGLTATNPSHGELSAIDQSADHRQGETPTPRGSGLRNTGEQPGHLNPTKEQASTIRIRDVRAVRSRNEILRPHSWRGRGFIKYVGCS